MKFYMKPRIFRAVYYNTLIGEKRFSLWTVRYGPKYGEMTRYFDAWSDALEYVISGKCEKDFYLIQMGLYREDA